MVLSPFSRRWCRPNGVEVEVQNFVEHLLISLVGGRLEQVAMAAPERVHQQHRAQHPRRDCGIHLAELTAPGAALDDARDETEDPLDHLAAIEAREVGKIAELRVNESEERGKVRRAKKAPVAANELRERFGRGLLRRGGKLALGALDLGDDRLPNDLS